MASNGKGNSQTKQEDRAKCMFLISSDNKLLQLLKYVLADEYIVAAFNLELIYEQPKVIPDIIVIDASDLQNRRQILSSNFRKYLISYKIPLVLLTDSYFGVERESDLQYISVVSAPYKLADIILKIRNITLNAQFPSNEAERTVAKAFDNYDFVNRVCQIVAQNYASEDFNVCELCSSLFVSRAYLYKHFTVEPALTPAQYIREFRLQIGHSLLLYDDMNVSEVAYKVGYNSSRYFTAHFKKMFGVTPSQLLKQN